MPEHIRALVTVLVLSTALLFVARPAMVQVIPAEIYDRWRKLWIFTTLAWFLSGIIWIYVALMVVVLTKVRKKEPQVFGLYLLLLFAAPSAPTPIPGFGVIDHVIMLDHYRLLALTLLLPTAWILKKEVSTVRFGRSPVDWVVFGYLLLTWVVTLPQTSVTNGLRGGVLQCIDGWLPYYVASRSIKSVEDFRIALGGLLIGALMLSILAIFEVLRSWKLYSASIAEYGLPISQHYKARGPFVRPGATVQDSIVIGAVVVLGLCIMLFVKDRIAGKLKSGILWATLLMGLLASLSRAPWMAGVLIFFLFYVLEGKTLKTLLQGVTILSLVLLLLSYFPAGRVIVDLLPFVGQTEQGSIDYRMNWFSASLPVIEKNFWFGDVGVMSAPELAVMKNGEGIIDLVNTFLAVLLHYGAVGLALFLGAFFLALKSVWSAKGVAGRDSAELSRLRRSLVVAVISVMFIIFTLSAISVVPILIWTLIGSCLAYGFLRKIDGNINELPAISPGKMFRN